MARPHFPCLEGLRALAATMVVVHHVNATSSLRRAGLLRSPASVMDGGVAIFFVISGFLIYRPFVVSHLEDRPARRMRTFWWLRLVRVVPAYWAALTVLWALGAFDLGPHWWRYYLLVQVYWRDSVLGGIFQSWSLATEMTFYLLVPFWALALRAVTRRSPLARRAGVQLGGAALLMLGGIVARQVISMADPSWRPLSFNWLPTNLDLFGAGMALAVLSAWAAHDQRVRRLLERAAGVPTGLALAAGALFAWYAYVIGPVSFATGYRGWYWQRRQLVLVLISLALLVPAAFGDQDRGLVRRLWRWRPVAWVGVVSYGLYLWHFDLIKWSVERGGQLNRPPWAGWAGVEYYVSPFPLAVAGLGGGLVAAALSFYLLERPLQRRLRGRVSPAPTAASAIDPAPVPALPAPADPELSGRSTPR
ncbi:MAG: acyltransferase [Actinobacteria bacterium]|nr:acyltransferase [Actinomycetota bacterium]